MVASNILAVDFRLALRNILRQRRRSLIAVAAIGFGIISMMLAAGYIEWIFWANREGVTVTQLGHVQVTRPGYHEGGKADPFTFLLPDQSPALEAIRDKPEVKSVVPRLSFNGLISHGESTLSFVGEGIHPELDPSAEQLIVTQGALLSSKDPKGFVLGSGLAANLGVKTGDTIVLMSNTESGGINAIEGHVRGVASTAMKAYDDSMLRVGIDVARELLRVPGAHVWITTLHSTDLTDKVTQQIKAEKDLAPLRGGALVRTGRFLQQDRGTAQPTDRGNQFDHRHHHHPRHQQHHDHERAGTHRRDRHRDGSGCAPSTHSWLVSPGRSPVGRHWRPGRRGAGVYRRHRSFPTSASPCRRLPECPGASPPRSGSHQ
jgi:hypothetical protein